MSETPQYLDDTGTPYISYELDDEGNLLEGVRVDGYVDIILELSQSDHVALTAAATTLGVSMEELILQALAIEMAKH